MQHQTYPEFGDMLRACRLAAGLRLVDVAQRMGWSKAYVYHLESGRARPPAPDVVQRLAVVFGVSSGPLLEAAARTRGMIRLPLDGSPASRVALALAHRWDSLTGDQIKAIRCMLSDADGA